MECVSAITRCMPVTLRPSENDSLSMRAGKVALLALGSLVGFVFLPLAAAMAFSAIVTMGCTLLYCRGSSPPKPSESAPPLTVSVPEPSPSPEKVSPVNDVSAKEPTNISPTPSSSSLTPASLPSIAEGDEPSDDPEFDAEFHTRDGLPVTSVKEPDLAADAMLALFESALGSPRGITVPRPPEVVVGGYLP